MSRIHIFNSMRDNVNDLADRVKNEASKVRNYFGKTLSPVKVEKADVSRGGRNLLVYLTAIVAVYALANKLKAETVNSAIKEPTAKTRVYKPHKDTTQVSTEDSTPLGIDSLITEAGTKSATRADIVNKVTWILSNTNPANVYYTTPGEGTVSTQAAIDNPTKTVIYWNPGTYSTFTSIDDCYILNPNKIYILNGATIHGWGFEHKYTFQITNGGPVIVLGINGSKVENFKQNFIIGNSQFNDILLEGLDMSFYEYGVWMDNIPGSVHFTSAPVVLNLGVADGGSKFAKFDELLGAREESPYYGVFKCSIINMSADKGAIDLTKYYVVSSMGEGVILSTAVVLGQNEQEENVFVNCNAPWDPNHYPLFSSPTQNGYKDVTNPFIGEPDDDNLIVDANDIYGDTLRPVRFGKLHNKDGSFRGALEPVSTMKSVAYFTNCWLAQGDANNPEDPNNDANYDVRADFDKNGVINFKDFANVANEYVSEEGEPISKANLPKGQYSPGQKDYAVVFNFHFKNSQIISFKNRKI